MASGCPRTAASLLPAAASGHCGGRYKALFFIYERACEKKMTVGEYIARSLGHPDAPRADLINGEIYAHAAERVHHLRVKHKAAVVLETAIAKAGAPALALRARKRQASP
jgi:hypothetical protein